MKTHPSPSQKLRQRLGRVVGAIAGLMGGIGVSTPAVLAQEVEYRSASTAPIEWQAFAVKTRQRIFELLGMDDEAALRVRRLVLDRLATAEPTAEYSIVSRLWIGPDSRIERIEFDRLDPELTNLLLGVLAGVEIGMKPPHDMPQPVHVKLSLGPNG